MTAAPTRTAGLPQLLVLLAASSLSVLGAVLIAPVLPQMSAHFADVPGVGILVPLVLTVPALVIGLTAPFAGVIVDRIGRVRILLVALVVYAAAGTAPLWLDDLGSIIASRVVVGVCEAAIMTSATTLIGDYWTGDRRNRYLGLQATVATISATAFIAAGGALGVGGWRAPFWMYLVSLILVVPAARLLWTVGESSSGEASVRVPLPWRTLVVPCLVSVVGGAVFYALIVQLSFVLNGIGVTSSGMIGAATAVMSIATAIGAALFGKLIRLGRRTLLPAEFALAGTGLVVVFATSSLPVILAGAMITGFATGVLLPTLLTWAVDRLDYAARGRGTGLWTGSLFVGEFFSPLVIAAFAAATGGLQSGIAVLGALSVAVATVLWIGLSGRAVVPAR
ncbi:MFS transporter [Lentzea sp. BCCO 10_0061]|uniref:MFS transporter n=1 Tax=Lentzea sokolovensis TaxID=3095429 RepID=A0ABU4USK0_9PSEU|nr:MFS transporter [Lentzea sp. BCCO 10_0061]MDX8141695.1 MFS transporter [Lentzea sp. BCCO 10_0061]